MALRKASNDLRNPKEAQEGEPIWFEYDSNVIWYLHGVLGVSFLEFLSPFWIPSFCTFSFHRQIAKLDPYAPLRARVRASWICPCLILVPFWVCLDTVVWTVPMSYGFCFNFGFYFSPSRSHFLLSFCFPAYCILWSGYHGVDWIFCICTRSFSWVGALYVMSSSYFYLERMKWSVSGPLSYHCF